MRAGCCVRTLKDDSLRCPRWGGLVPGRRGVKPARRMTAAEFEAVRGLIHMSPERIAAARAVLVDGETLSAAAEPYGWHRQAADTAVRAFLRTFVRYTAAQQAGAAADTLPTGWVRVTLEAPADLIARFQQEVAAVLPAKNKPPATLQAMRTRKKPSAG